MRHAKAIFVKQFKSTVANPESMIQFIIYPALAFIMTLVMVDFYGYGIPADIIEAMQANMPNLVTMQATIFAGMALIPVVASIIAEDIEKKSLRFLTMAGVKPMSYLIGVSGVILIVSFFSSAAFSWIGEFQGVDFWIFTAAMMSGVVGSLVLGATVGIACNGSQSAQGLTLPLAIVLGFGPMMAQFNDRIAHALRFIFTQQLNIIADYMNGVPVATPLWESFAIMWANVAVLLVIFAVVYRKFRVAA